MKKPTLFLILVCIAVILAAGCASTSSTSSATTSVSTTAPVESTITTPVLTPAPAPVEVVTPATPVATTASVQDPILHRWLRQYPTSGSTSWAAYQFIFYGDGSVVYDAGTPKETMSNIQIDPQQPSVELSGTWAKSGINTYLVKLLPIGTAAGAPIIREYTWVPAAKDPQYGYIVPEHIVSQFEIDEYAHLGRDLFSDEMKYPERVKID